MPLPVSVFHPDTDVFLLVCVRSCWLYPVVDPLVRRFSVGSGYLQVFRALKHARVARLLAVGDNAPLPPPYGVPGPDDGDLVGGRDPEEEELIPQEDRASVPEKLAHLVLRKALVSHFTFFNRNNVV